jgi:RNA polymerase sigma-70 factor (ECF subfamily)
VSNQTDDELMLAIQKNNDLAYTELVNRYIDKLYGYLLRLTSNTNDAEDLVQETFLKVWNKSTTYKVGKVRFSTWLYRIAHNKFIDLYRKNKFRAEAYEEQMLSRTMEDLSQQEEKARALSLALSTLPENQRVAVLLSHNQSFTNPEIATILGSSVRAVESTLSRARKTLRKLLTEEPNNDAY